MISSNTVRPSTPLILVTGKNGQVGWELQRSLAPLGEVITLNRSEMDLSDSDAIRKKIQEIKPDVIVNAAAYTAVDKAENEKELAMQVNGVAPGVMAEEAKRIGALLVHYSTDYVFDGSKDTAFTESDLTNPLNEYGKTKLAGEKNIQGTAVDHIILRTSWVYSSRGNNFLRTILRLAYERDELNIVADQIGSPTSARFIADVTAHILQQSLLEKSEATFRSDLYNLVSTSATSWHGFASKIVELSKKHLNNREFKVENINTITTEEYPVPAPRPLNSRLSIDKVSMHFNLFMPDWEHLLKLCIQEIDLRNDTKND